jgi:CRISPR-associated endonuclease Csn1
MDRMKLWHEHKNGEIVICPYSGTVLSVSKILSAEVEIDHILPFSRTLDDGRSNKILCIREANRLKTNLTPFEAKNLFAQQGWDYEQILSRVSHWSKNKRYRFDEDAMDVFLKDQTFLARALNDTRYLSRIAKEYLTLICPKDTRVIPGQMTAMLRDKFGLNDILSVNGKKNREDHRHHAIDACVIGVTDQPLLDRFAKANAQAQNQGLNRLVDNMPLPWETYQKHVKRAIDNIYVSHKPDHGYEGAMHEETAYRPPHRDPKGEWRTRGINGEKPNSKTPNSTGVISIKNTMNLPRYGKIDEVFKGYFGGNNYCMDIFKNGKGKWEAKVITVFDAYQICKTQGKDFFQKSIAFNGLPLIMRLVTNDCIRMKVDGIHPDPVLKIKKMRSDRHKVTVVAINEANESEREKEIELYFDDLSANQLYQRFARKVTISPIGEIRDHGFKE